MWGYVDYWCEEGIENNMNKSQIQFLELLRAGLWGVAPEPDNFKPDSIDWQALLCIAKEQTMVVVVTDGIKMTVGVRRRTHEKVQYCITALDI